MAGYVKLYTRILDSTVWHDKYQRDVFITALLMAEPHVIDEPTPQLKVDSLEQTGWSVPPGWYGIVHAAGIGIISRALIEDAEKGMRALAAMGEPEATSRSAAFDGRRIVRIDGGFLILNYDRYRERDMTGAIRQARFRARKAGRLPVVTSQRYGGVGHPGTLRNITQAEGEEEIPPSAGASAHDPTAPEHGAPEAPQSARLPWGVHGWYRAFSVAWCEKYRQISYGGGAADAKACASLGDVLEALSPAERTAAEDRAQAMLAEFLGDSKPEAVRRRHPFVFFAAEFNALRVPKRSVSKPAERCGWHERGGRGDSRKPLETCPDCRENRSRKAGREGEPTSSADSTPPWLRNAPPLVTADQLEAMQRDRKTLRGASNARAPHAGANGLNGSHGDASSEPSAEQDTRAGPNAAGSASGEATGADAKGDRDEKRATSV